jgi:hypothetical protein
VTKALTQWFYEGGQELYALVDAARDPQIISYITQKQVSLHCLFDGIKKITLAEVAPYILKTAELREHLPAFVEQAWGKSCTVIISSPQSLAQVRLQLKKNLLIQLADQGTAYFRFYDSRALNKFFAIASVGQTEHLNGDCITKWHWMGDTKETMNTIESTDKKILFGLANTKSYSLHTSEYLSI